MIPENCTFDEVKDIQPVNQFGFISMTDALTKGYVDSSVAPDTLAFDGDDLIDTALVGSRVRNVFDAMNNLQNLPSQSAEQIP